MQLSIREASRFVIGVAVMREKAIAASGNTGIAFDHIATATLIPGGDGLKLRNAIETLADQESSWLRNTPPHILKSERVLQSREAEIRAFNAIHAAVYYTLLFAEEAQAGDVHRTSQLHQKYEEAIKAIEATPGSTQSRRQLVGFLREEATNIAVEKRDFVIEVLNRSERSYLDARAEAILSRYSTLERSDDFDM